MTVNRSGVGTERAPAQTPAQSPARPPADRPARTAAPSLRPPRLRVAVVGAGPAGLALGLHALRQWDDADITVFDGRAEDHDYTRDSRTLALSLGSLMLLERLGVWPLAPAADILSVHVSQAPPGHGGPAATRLSAAGLGVPRLGAVVGYGTLVQALQRACQQAAGAPATGPRASTLALRFGTPVRGLKAMPAGSSAAAARKGTPHAASASASDSAAGRATPEMEVDASTAECFDLVVVAEGGVFADQARKSIVRDYHQNAWVGEAWLDASGPEAWPAGAAFERFTRHGPVALLPLSDVAPAAGAASPPSAPAPTQAATRDATQASATRRPGADGRPGASLRRAALVWCVPAEEDPVAVLDDAQRVTVLQTLLPAEAGRLQRIGPLKCFALGLNAERTLVDGRCVRIGNAAQTLHPVAGQGLNLGLRDVQTLVDTLRWREGRQIDAALRQIEWARAPDRWATIATTDFLARSFTWKWAGFGAARSLALGALDAIGPLRDGLARRLMVGWR